jgi:polyisoprenoid-binding protein YceI
VKTHRLPLISVCSLLLPASILLAAGDKTEIYKIDAAQSHFNVHVARSGLFKMFGHDHNIAVRDFSGTAAFTPGAIQPASLEMTVKADSLAVMDDVKEAERAEIENTMKTQVLETKTYPTIVFKSTKITVTSAKTAGHHAAHIAGNLTLHGVTKPLAFDGDLEIAGGKLRAKGAFPVKQSDFGIKPVSKAGGTVKVKDELKLDFDIVAHP